MIKSCLRFACFVLYTSVSVFPLTAGWQAVGNVTALEPNGNTLTLRNREAILAITVLAADLVRVRMTHGAAFGLHTSWAVVKRDWPPFHIEFSGDKQTRVIRTPELEVRVQLSPFRLSFYDSSGRLISRDDNRLGSA